MTKTKYRVTYFDGDNWNEASVTEDEDFASHIVNLCHKAGAIEVRKEEI